tara:strand:- start:12791 stop:13135 length:345 start_codon:yes stop_codon:yes gene_type:complete
MSSKDSLRRSNRPPYTSDPTYYEQLNEELGQYYYHPSAYQRAMTTFLKKTKKELSWKDFQEKRPLLSTFLIKIFGDKAVDVHLILDFDISEERAGDLLVALEDFDFDEYARIRD